MVIKRLLHISAIIVLLTIAVLLVRTAMFESRQLVVDDVKPLHLDANKLAQQLAGALTYQTISHKDPSRDDIAVFEGLHAYLRETFSGVHQYLNREVIDKRHLVYHWPGSDKTLKPVLFIAHLDVVPVEQATLAQWQHPPFAGRVDDKFIWGRGSLDDKSSVVGLLAATDKLLEKGVKPKRTIYFAFGGDEEVGGKRGAAIIANHFKQRDIQFEFVVDEGGIITEGIVQDVELPVALIGIAEKGYVSFDLQVETEGGHSSMPPKQSAIGILSNAITKIEQQPMPPRLTPAMQTMFDYLGPELPFPQRLVMANRWLFEPFILKRLSQRPSNNATIRSTAVVTEMHSGTAENVLPKQARAVVNFRLLTGDSVAKIERHLQRIIADNSIKVTRRKVYQQASSVSEITSNAFINIHSTVKQVFADTVVAPYLVVAATDSRHYEAVADNIYRFQPVRLQQQDLARFHGMNERISITGFSEMVQFYAALMAKL